MTVVRARPQADRDADAAAEFFVREANLDIALQFLSAVELAYQRLAEHPHIGTTVSAFEPRLSGLRFWPVPGFESYLVFYVPEPEVVDIVRILHGARELAPLLEGDLKTD